MSLKVTGFVGVPWKNWKLGGAAVLTLQHVPENGEAVAHECERRSTLDGALNAILRVFETELAPGFVGMRFRATNAWRMTR